MVEPVHLRPRQDGQDDVRGPGARRDEIDDRPLVGRRPDRQHVAGLQRRRTDARQLVRGARAQDRRHVDAAADHDVGPQARAATCPPGARAPAPSSSTASCATGVPSTQTGPGAPVTATVAGSTVRNRRPPSSTSRPAAPSGLATSRLPSRSEPRVGRAGPAHPDVRPARPPEVLDQGEHARVEDLDHRHRHEPHAGARRAAAPAGRGRRRRAARRTGRAAASRPGSRPGRPR